MGQLEEMVMTVGFIGTAIAIASAVFAFMVNMGQLVGSMPCRRIAPWGRNQRIKVHRKGARGAGLPMVQVRMTTPKIAGWGACLLTPGPAMRLADLLDLCALELARLRPAPGPLPGGRGPRTLAQ